MVFDLFVLVSDPISAAGELVRAGYMKSQANPRYKNVPQLSDQVMRLVQPDEDDPNVFLDDNSVLPEADDTIIAGVVLLPAMEWGYKLPEDVCDLQYLVLDHIVSKWMDLEGLEGEADRPLRDHLGIHIGYCTGYVDEVWSMGFARQVRREHRQLLFDLQATATGKETAANHSVELLTEECWVLQREFRDRILQESCDPPDLNAFTFKRPAREEVGMRVTMTVTPADMKLVDYFD